ncbi:MAG: ribonuclease Z [Hyphomicrobium sp.]
MTPLFHPRLVNDPFGDPGVLIEWRFERRAFLFDLGDNQPLSSRSLLRISDAFVSHAHMDHFIGFDRLLRIILGRGRGLRLYGPASFIDRVGHKLAGYTWNLAGSYTEDLVLAVTEVHSPNGGAAAEFHLKDGFHCRRPPRAVTFSNGIVVDEDAFRIRAAVIDHGIPCLALALEEKSHVNVLKGAVEAMGFRVGPWLRDLRRATLAGVPDGSGFRVRWRESGEPRERVVPLGELKARMLRIVPGQKIAYVTDAAFHEANAETIVQLACDADVLFIEAPFLDRDAAIAAAKRHLTAGQAGRLGRLAGARRLVPFHFSARYQGEGDALLREAEAARA